MRMQDRLITIGCLISESNASRKTCLSNSDNVERILSRTASIIEYRQRICAIKQEKLILTSSLIINQIPI